MSTKENMSKKILFGIPFARANIVPNFFGTRFAKAAILAVFGRNLPFWQYPLLCGESIYPPHGGLAIPPAHTVSRYHAILPSIVSIVRVPNLTTRNRENAIGSLLEVERPETLSRFHSEKVSLAFDLALAFHHASQRNRGGILRALILANHLQTHHVFTTNRNHRFFLPCDALILQK